MKFMRNQKGICIGIFLIIALFLSTIGYLTYLKIENVVIQRLAESAEKVAVTAAHFIEVEKRGSYLSGYAPIRDPQTGEVLSVVGVDFSSNSITVLMKNIKQALVIGISALIILTSFIVFKLIRDRFEAENIDYLTELHSKRYHDKQLADFIEKARNSECHLFLMMIDIDFFKEINDEYGHDIGDQVLKYVACTIKTNARKTDICSRFGELSLF